MYFDHTCVSEAHETITILLYESNSGFYTHVNELATRTHVRSDILFLRLMIRLADQALPAFVLRHHVPCPPRSQRGVGAGGGRGGFDQTTHISQQLKVAADIVF